MAENDKLTITLTGRRPVTIVKEDWPVIASAEHKDFDNQYEFQASRTSNWRLTVRQHDDGRAIVYGSHTHDTHFQSEECRSVRGGKLLAKDADIPAAIREVAEELESRLEGTGDWSEGVFPRLAHECTANLPAEVI